MTSGVVFDASALIAYLFDEPGAAVVERRLQDAVMSTINFSEVLTRFVRDGHALVDVVAQIQTLSIQLVPLDEHLAIAAAALSEKGRRVGLSLGDRVCLALAHHLGASVLTTDRAWAELEVGGADPLKPAPARSCPRPAQAARSRAPCSPRRASAIACFRRAISCSPSLTSGGRTTARSSRPSRTSASFIRLCMSRKGGA